MLQSRCIDVLMTFVPHHTGSVREGRNVMTFLRDICGLADDFEGCSSHSIFSNCIAIHAFPFHVAISFKHALFVSIFHTYCWQSMTSLYGCKALPVYLLEVHVTHS